MRRPVRRSRLLVLASLAMLVATTAFTVSPAALAAGPKTDGAKASAVKKDSGVRGGSRGSINVSKLSIAGAVTLFAAAAPIPEDPVTKVPHPGATSGPAGVGALAVPPPTARSRPRTTCPAGDRSGVGRLLVRRRWVPPPDPWVACRSRACRADRQHRHPDLRPCRHGRDPPTEIGIPELFNLPPGFGNSDPRVIYDSLHGRWVGTEVSWTCDGDGDGTADDPIGYIDFIVSRTADPTGVWDLYFFGFLERASRLPGPGHVDRQARVHRQHVHVEPGPRLHFRPGDTAARNSSSPIGPTSWLSADQRFVRLRRLRAWSGPSTTRDESASSHPRRPRRCTTWPSARPASSRFGTHSLLPQDRPGPSRGPSPSRSSPN